MLKTKQMIKTMKKRLFSEGKQTSMSGVSIIIASAVLVYMNMFTVPETVSMILPGIVLLGIKDNEIPLFIKWIFRNLFKSKNT